MYFSEVWCITTIRSELLSVLKTRSAQHVSAVVEWSRNTHIRNTATCSWLSVPVTVELVLMHGNAHQVHHRDAKSMLEGGKYLWTIHSVQVILICNWYSVVTVDNTNEWESKWSRRSYRLSRLEIACSTFRVAVCILGFRRTHPARDIIGLLTCLNLHSIQRLLPVDTNDFKVVSANISW
jgi:hypothetical protein